MGTIEVSAAYVPTTGRVRYCVRCLAIYRQDFQRCPLDGGALVVGANDPWIGHTLGRYVIEAMVGEGAMGRVYRAHPEGTPEQRFAIKVMIGDLAATAQMRARFVLEAEHASRLDHPNIVRVHDFDQSEHGLHYMVMDLIEGRTLGAIVGDGPLDPERVIRIVRQLCEGLDYAHGRGVIHRDFKPENILVTATGDSEVARIADFGLSLSTQHETRLTTTGVVCTPAYASPEQLRGAPIDQRVDLYALGTTMFEMLSGGLLPFGGDLDASVTNKLSRGAPSILTAAPDVPPALVSIVDGLLSPSPERRPRSARALMRALDQAVRAPQVAIRTDHTAPMRIPTWRNRGNATVQLRARRPSERSIDELLTTSPRRLRRAGIQLFACAIALAGVLAWFDMRSPSSADAEPTVAAAAAPVDLAPNLADLDIDRAMRELDLLTSMVAAIGVLGPLVASSLPWTLQADSPVDSPLCPRPVIRRDTPTAMRIHAIERCD